MLSYIAKHFPFHTERKKDYERGQGGTVEFAEGGWMNTNPTTEKEDGLFYVYLSRALPTDNVSDHSKYVCKRIE